MYLMSYLCLAMVTLIWKQTVAFLLSVKWRDSISITGYRRHLLFRTVNSMHSEPFKIKAVLVTLGRSFHPVYFQETLEDPALQRASPILALTLYQPPFWHPAFPTCRHSDKQTSHHSNKAFHTMKMCVTQQVSLFFLFMHFPCFKTRVQMW